MTEYTLNPDAYVAARDAGNRRNYIREAITNLARTEAVSVIPSSNQQTMITDLTNYVQRHIKRAENKVSSYEDSDYGQYTIPQAMAAFAGAGALIGAVFPGDDKLAQAMAGAMIGSGVGWVVGMLTRMDELSEKDVLTMKREAKSELRM
jgi:hypothetical protein